MSDIILAPKSYIRATAPLVAGRFHIPFEHGAWWSFLSTLLGALLVAVIKGADSIACLSLFVSLGAGFVAQDWGQAILAKLLGRRSQALSQWQAWQGWTLAAVSLAGAGLVVARLDTDQRMAWVALLGILGLGASLGLGVRIFQMGRGRKSLALTALLLASPALPFGVLAFGLKPLAFIFWVWPLCYYPAATLAAQSFIRGFPLRARWAGPGMAAALAGAAAGAEAWLAAGLLLIQAMRLNRAIQQRWQQQPEGMPPGGAIRAFGKEQATFGVGLTILWAIAFARL